MLVRFTKDWEGHKVGTTADLPDAKAKKAVAAGAAEDPSGGKQPETMRVWVRRQFAVKGTDGNVQTCANGAMCVIPNNEEGWEAINRGDADLNPPPGVAGQPFPPPFVTRSEATEVADDDEADVVRPVKATPKPAPADQGEEPKPATGTGTGTVEGPVNKLPAPGEVKKAQDRK